MTCHSSITPNFFVNTSKTKFLKIMLDNYPNEISVTIPMSHDYKCNFAGMDDLFKISE